MRHFVHGIGVRQVRIACGLVMFCYLVSHFTNHALGNISYAAMKERLKIRMAIWRFVPVAVILYSAAVVHASLGLWALYQRRHFHWKAPEIVQLALGLSIPALMLQHLIGLRLPPLLWDTQRYYAHALSFYWSNPDHLSYTLGGLVVAWTHACIGLFFWLRMRRVFKRTAPFLLAGAVLLPTLALLGIYQGGRNFAELQKSPEWRRQEITQPASRSQRVLIDDLKAYTTTDEIRKSGGVAADALRSTLVTLRGRDAQMSVCAIARAREFSPAA